MLRSIGFAALLGLFGVTAGHAQDGGRGELLGGKAVDFKAERDTISVTAREGRFDAVRLHVEGNAIEILDVNIHFGNGEKQDVSVRETIREGGATRVIDLER